MSVTSVSERWEERSFSDDGKIRTYVRAWQVLTNDQTDSQYIVRASLPVQVGNPHPDDWRAFVQSIDIKNVDTWTKWIATANYSTATKKNENPLNDPAKIVWGDEQFQKVFEKDINGKAVLNKAGDYFDPPHMIDDARSTATVTKNVASVPSWILNYKNVINNAAFMLDGISIPTGKAKIKAIGISEEQERNDILYRTLTIPIFLDKNGWKVSLLNAGYFNADRTHCVDANGKGVSVPVPLDNTGYQIPTPTFNNATYCDFDGYEEVSFSVLPLT